MYRFFRLAQTLLSVYYAYMIEYRAELILWTLSNSLPIILMGIWMEAAETGNFALNPLEFARYFIAVFFIRQLLVVWVIWEFEPEVVEGKLSFKLLQPLDPVWHHVAQHIAERLARMPFVFGLLLLCGLLYPQAIWWPNLGNFILSLIVIVLAFIMRFLMQYTFALLAFWMERVAAIEQVWHLFYIFTSGLIAPLLVFPDRLRDITLWTPFPYFLYVPAALLVGLPVDILHSLLVMFAWTGLIFIANRWLWRRGLSHYSGMGA